MFAAASVLPAKHWARVDARPDGFAKKPFHFIEISY
jgi:hypothetical protein